MYLWPDYASDLQSSIDMLVMIGCVLISVVAVNLFWDRFFNKRNPRF